MIIFEHFYKYFLYDILYTFKKLAQYFNTIFNFVNHSAPISHNVLNNWRSSPPYKANRRFAVGWIVGERKPHKAVGDCGFSNPEPPNRRRSSYCLLDEGHNIPIKFIWFLIFNKEYLILFYPHYNSRCTGRTTACYYYL